MTRSLLPALVVAVLFFWGVFAHRARPQYVTVKRQLLIVLATCIAWLAAVACWLGSLA